MKRTDRSQGESVGHVSSDQQLVGLTRRTLLTRAGLAGIAAVGGSAVLAACSTPSASPQPSASVAGPSASAARKGGRITLALANESGGLDPQLLTAYTAVQFFYRVYEQLVTVDSNNKVVPNLAASWTQPSPTRWVFKLRDDVKFSNGRPLRASDVVGTFERLYDPKMKFFIPSFLGPVTVQAIDDLTVQFDQKDPFAPFLQGLATFVWILPAQELKAGTFDPTKDMLGTGPFVLKETLKGESWTFARNPYYWRQGLPVADELVMLIIPDQGARIAALQSGRADVAIFDSIDAPRLLTGAANVKTVAQDLPDFLDMWINAKTPMAAALKDQRVRQAIYLAIDRDQIIKTAFGGNAKPVYGTVPSLADSCDASRLPQRDVAKAKSLLAAAGASGLSFEIMVQNTDQPGLQTAQVLVQSLAEAGINAHVQSLDVGVWRQRSYLGTDPAQFDAAVTFTSASGDNWRAFTSWSLAASAFASKFELPTPEFDALFQKTANMPAGPDRAAVFQQMCGMIADVANIIPLVTKFNTVAYRSDHLNANVPTSVVAGDFVGHLAEYSRKD